MHHVAGPAFLIWLETSGFAQAMRQWLWLYPIVEVAHIIGIALLVGSIVMFDLRLLGLSRNVSVIAMGRHLIPWTLAGFALVLATGSMMFSAHATEFWYNPAFVVKMSLIAVAGLNAMSFHYSVYATATAWDVGVPAPRSAKFSAAASIVFWIAVITCGRLIAYL